MYLRAMDARTLAYVLAALILTATAAIVLLVTVLTEGPAT